jgi:hypothetical protein
LPADVPAGEAVRLDARIGAPAAAGDYELRLDLVSHWVTWFADQSSTPLRIPIRVRSLDAAGLLHEPIPTDGMRPNVSISTDQPSYGRGDSMQLRVDLWNPNRPGLFDAFLILQRPDGAAMFYDGQGEVGSESKPPMRWAKDLPLPARATGRFRMPLSNLQPGGYEWHVVLVDTNPRAVAARAITRFSITP